MSKLADTSRIQLKKWDLTDADDLSAIGNAVDRTFLSDRLPFPYTKEDAEIGYFLLTDNQSKGLMTEAVKQICEIAFSELDIIRITGLVYEPNIASQKVLKKNGFSLEGTMKNAVIKNGKVQDLCIYGKLKETDSMR